MQLSGTPAISHEVNGMTLGLEQLSISDSTPPKEEGDKRVTTLGYRTMAADILGRVGKFLTAEDIVAAGETCQQWKLAQINMLRGHNEAVNRLYLGDTENHSDNGREGWGAHGFVSRIAPEAHLLTEAARVKGSQIQSLQSIIREVGGSITTLLHVKKARKDSEGKVTENPYTVGQAKDLVKHFPNVSTLKLWNPAPNALELCGGLQKLRSLVLAEYLAEFVRNGEMGFFNAWSFPKFPQLTHCTLLKSDILRGHKDYVSIGGAAMLAMRDHPSLTHLSLIHCGHIGPKYAADLQIPRRGLTIVYVQQKKQELESGLNWSNWR
jgi:hypothetical protein